jgi:hypothetical protein
MLLVYELLACAFPQVDHKEECRIILMQEDHFTRRDTS